MNQKGIFFLLFIFITLSFSSVGCQKFNSDTGSRASNALCQGINPLKPSPSIPSSYSLFDELHIFAGKLPVDENCDFAYRRVISVSPSTDQDEKQIQVVLTSSDFDYSHANPDASDIRFLDDQYNIFDHWVEIWDTSGTSIIWVKVPTTGTTDFFMIYGNPGATNLSNSGAIFTYSTPQANYVELRNSGTPQTMNVASYGDSNTVSVTINTGTSVNTLSSGSVLPFNNSVVGLISSNGPIEGRAQTDAAGYDTVSHVGLAGTLMGYPKSRNNDYFEFYNPGTVIANITLTDFNSAGTFISSQPNTVNPGEFKQINFDFSYFGLVESDVPLVGFYLGSSTSDATPTLPGDTNLLGVNSSGATIGILQDGTSGTIYFSSSASTPFSGGRGDSVVVSTGSVSQGDGEAMHIVSNNPIIAVAQADSDGADTFSFWPVSEISNEYIIPADSQYIAISTLYSSTITVYNSSGGVITSTTTTSDGITPAKAYFGTTGNIINFNTGTRVASDKPFFMYYEYGVNDESNILGAKVNRLRSALEPTVSVGEEFVTY